MRIAIHAADLDRNRIDGTRVYLFNLLKNFGELSKKDKFCIYHQSKFNPHLKPPTFDNYQIKRLPFLKLWTQTRFAWQLFWDKPDVLWMPVHNVPLLRRKKMKVVVTIHDLAFKIFPAYFPSRELRKLNRLSDHSINNADRIIAVSESTKKDILKFYPHINGNKITVIHHGFDPQMFSQVFSEQQLDELLSQYDLQKNNFILYVGAIQPRKNLAVLIEAFEQIKQTNSDLKLVLAGAPAWQFQGTLDKITQSKFKQDIMITGTLPFEQIVKLYRTAKLFVFPSLYEGFGIPVLEAFASGVPVVLANNSSLLEVGADAALFFETGDSKDLAKKIQIVIADSELRTQMIKKGLERAKNFTWQRCAKLTLDKIVKW